VALVAAVGEFLDGAAVSADGDDVAGMAVFQLLCFFRGSGFPKLGRDAVFVNCLPAPELLLSFLSTGFPVVRLYL
jgi:hypothetical protein